MADSTHIASGNDLKFMVRADIEGFSMTENAYSITIVNRWGAVFREITQKDMLIDDIANFYFTLSDVPTGVYYAVFSAHIPDQDFPEGRQQRVYRQHLVTVGCCDRMACECGCGGSSPIEYTRITTKDIAGGTYIYDVDGDPIIDKNGHMVRLSMTALEFKKLIEGRDDNGEIDTVPELLDAVSGLSENTEYTVMTDSDVDEMMGRILDSR